MFADLDDVTEKVSGISDAMQTALGLHKVDYRRSETMRSTCYRRSAVLFFDERKVQLLHEADT
jgi:hypothetical protein